MTGIWMNKWIDSWITDRQIDRQIYRQMIDIGMENEQTDRWKNRHD